MKILAIDTSSSNCSIAILENQKIIGNFNINIGKTHSETLLPLVDELLKLIDVDLNEIDAFACCVGPGSFTGIRIGIATIKGLAISLNKPVVSVTSLESLCFNVPHFNGIVCSILNANNNNVYSAFYSSNNSIEMIGDYHTDSIDELIKEAKNFKENIMFVGDGATFYHDTIKDALQDKAFFVPSHFNDQSAVSVAMVAIEKLNKNIVDSAYTVEPVYLRKSQAERLSQN